MSESIQGFEVPEQPATQAPQEKPYEEAQLARGIPVAAPKQRPTDPDELREQIEAQVKAHYEQAGLPHDFRTALAELQRVDALPENTRAQQFWKVSARAIIGAHYHGLQQGP